jgi:hypothetical protein
MPGGRPNLSRALTISVVVTLWALNFFMMAKYDLPFAYNAAISFWTSSGTSSRRLIVVPCPSPVGQR